MSERCPSTYVHQPSWGYGTYSLQCKHVVGHSGQHAALGRQSGDVLWTDSSVNWRHVAVQVARRDGAFHGLTTRERDALEDAMRSEDYGDALAASDAAWERHKDAAT